MWENEQCARNYKNHGHGRVLKTMLCAAGDKTDGCLGDSGGNRFLVHSTLCNFRVVKGCFMLYDPKGPLNCLNPAGSWELCGIVSWGSGCGKKSKLT